MNEFSRRRRDEIRARLSPYWWKVWGRYRWQAPGMLVHEYRRRLSAWCQKTRMSFDFRPRGYSSVRTVLWSGGGYELIHCPVCESQAVSAGERLLCMWCGSRFTLWSHPYDGAQAYTSALDHRGGDVRLPAMGVLIDETIHLGIAREAPWYHERVPVWGYTGQYNVEHHLYVCLFLLRNEVVGYDLVQAPTPKFVHELAKADVPHNDYEIKNASSLDREAIEAWLRPFDVDEYRHVWGNEPLVDRLLKDLEGALCPTQ